MKTARAVWLTRRFSATGLQALSSNSLTTAAPAFFARAAACNGVLPCITPTVTPRPTAFAAKFDLPVHLCLAVLEDVHHQGFHGNNAQ